MIRATAQEPMERQELRRRAYLQAMGITVYQPRLQLPAAPAPRVRLAVPDAGSSDPVASSERGRADGKDPAFQPEKTALERLLEKAELDDDPNAWRRVADPAPGSATYPTAAVSSDRTGNSPVGTPSQRSLPEASATPVSFRLCALQINEQLTVIEPLPWNGRDTLPESSWRLLGQLLLALGQPAGNEWPSQSFQWPFLNAPGHDQSAAAARAGLLAWLEAQQGDRVSARPPWLLFLDRDLAQALFAQVEGLLTSSGEARWTLLSTVSLQAMQDRPVLKRQVWRDLAPLRSTQH